MRDFFKHMLAETPQSDDSWHCPWFWTIQGYALNGLVFGFLSYIIYTAYLGLCAMAIGIGLSAYTAGSRSRSDSSC